MDNKIIIYFIINISSLMVISCTNQCRVENQMTECVYHIVCEKYAGTASNPNCNSDPYVIFEINNSTVELLGPGFFGSTNFDSRVREIRATNNNWPKILQLAFWYYPKTIILKLSNNNIKFISNLAFKSVFDLRRLDLSRNSISNLQSLSLITYEDKDSEIETLELSYNDIHEMPYDIFKYLGNLNQLYLDHNKLNELPDDLFTNLRALTTLKLQNNLLTALNITLLNLKALQYLDVSFNNIIKLSGYELNRITSLVAVNFSHNAIETIESNCFNQALNLVSLDLRYNKIKSVIDNVLFTNNGKLKNLYLEKNQITQIQDYAFKHNVIEELSLNNNNIAGVITKSTFNGLQNITSLNLYNQSITTINTDAFLDTHSLNILNLSRNHINIIENNSFGKSENLNILDLSYNKIVSVNFLNESLTNLTELYLNNNSLTELKSFDLKNQTQLKILDLSMNKIKIINKNFMSLNNLQYLKLSGNLLGGTIKADTFSPAKYLRYLDLNDFNITKIEGMAFVNMSVLARLNLSNNIIDEIDPNNFIAVNNMYSLDISHNRLKILELKELLPNLRSLYLNHNNFSIIPKMTMYGLLYLDLSYNNVTNLAEGTFKNLQSLKVLQLSNNSIKSVNNPYINSLSNLTDLGLSDNEITYINLTFFKELMSLDVSRNKISFINNTFLENLDSLQSLDISENNITKLPPGTFQSIKILKFLNVSSNHISNLRYGSFKGLHRTEVLDLSKNNIVDLDVDIFHECLELKKLIIDYNRIKILDIEKLLIVSPKLSYLSLGGNPVACKEIVHNMRNINHTLAFHPVEVTSIDKIYHEDNVYGIKCGDIDNNTSKIDDNKPISDKEPISILNIVIICCLLLILVFIISGLVFCYCKRKQFYNMYATESRLQMRRSLELNGSDFHSDLLS